ncbi:GA module [Gardnerella sp. DNF01199S]|uniref:GA module n=1 Tax=Gardnerella sp. DNF01199S TaxID=2749067 RepID=UPI003BAD3596
MGGGVFVSSPAYADGYVDGTGNNIYYGFKTDAKYAEAHFNIDVEYYDTFEHAKAGGTEGIDPLGKFVRVHYLSNCNNNATADDWRFRPMWWFGVPAGLKDPQDIQFKRIEKLTNGGKQSVKPAGSSQYVQTDANGYGAVSDKHFNSPKEWNNISNFYFSGENIASKGWKRLVGLSDKAGSKTYDNAGDTEKQWNIYKQDTQGLKGIFVDWESAGRRWYDMTYVSEMEDTAWKNRDKNPLRFAAGVYRFAGNWHYAVGQKHNTPKIADYFNLTYPAVTKVKDTKKLTDDEQKAVKEKIENANKNAKYYSDLVEKVEVSEKGVATITFKDNTTRTMPASLLVTKDESDSDKYKPTLPAATPVVNPSALTKEDKEAVIAAFKKANPDSSEFSKHLAKDNAIAFDKDGKNLVVTYKDGSKAMIPVSELVFQGPKISDWAPYVVPDVIQVDNLKQLSDDDVTKIKNKFDTANSDLDVYKNAKTKDSTGYLTIDKNTGNATIKWEDGSTTVIDAWQFLKEKEKTPAPQPPTPNPPVAEEKTFIVGALSQQKVVMFDPFKTTTQEITTGNIKTQLDNLKSTLKSIKCMDSKDQSDVTITDVEYSVGKDGVGYITFKANGYKDVKYPMSMFFKQNPNKQTPKETEHSPQGKTQYKYKVQPVEYEGATANAQDWIKALKQFVKSNYGKDLTNDSTVTETYVLPEGITTTEGTQGLQRFVKGKNNDSGVTTIHIGDNGVLEIQGYENGDNNLKTLFTVPASELYVKKGSHTDHTVSDLKDLAKKIRDEKKNSGVTDNDFKRAGIIDNTDDNTINGMNEQQLRNLIRKLTDAKKTEYKYNTNPVEIDNDPTSTTYNASDGDVQKAVKAFLKANYTDNGAATTIDNYAITGNSGNFNNITWNPKDGTKNLEMKSDIMPGGIDSFSMNDDGKSVDFKCGNDTLFTVPANKLFKKKVETPKPDKKQLEEMKKQAKEIIDRNPKLTDDQKTQYKNKIENATTKEQIQNILKEANKQAVNNNVTSEQLKQKEKTEKDKKEKEQKEKDKKEREKKQAQQLQDDKKKASESIDKLGNLSNEEKEALKKEINGDGTPGGSQGATTSDDVKKILEKAKAIDAAKGALQNDIAKGALPFLDHGTGAKGNTEATHADDAALNELLGGTPGKDKTLTDLETALAKKDATAQEIKDALAAAKRQNAINEENAKNAGIAKLDAKQADLDAAYNALAADQQAKAKAKYDAAVNEINTAKGKVNSATKPSDIKTAVGGVDTKIDAAKEDIKNNTPKRDTSQNTYDNQSELDKEKEAQKKRIQDSNLPDADKQKAIDDINNAKKLGDPTGIADRALKAKKIADALDKLDKDFNHLNKAQKEAFKKIIEDTDAGDHTNADGTTSDDIDDALANAANTDNAMARLEELKVIADKFANGEKYKGASQEKKDAFNTASTAAGAVLDKAKGDAKSAAEVNDIYADLLKAMQAIDNTVKGAGVKTDALAAEVESDKNLKPNDKADPKTPGDSSYTTASADKKKAFDDALTEAEAALKTANEENENAKNPNRTPRTPEQEAKAQKAVDEALDKLIKARLALDGVNTKPLEQQIAKDADIKKSVEYTKASDSKKKAYDEALAAAEKLIAQLTGKDTQQGGQGAQQSELKTKEQKQQALDAALKALRDAAAALDGKDTTPVPPSDDDNTGSGSESDSGSGDSTSTSGGVNKQNLINQINTTENPGGANPGSGAAGTNPSTPGAGAQGAGMGAVTPGSGAGAAGTGAAGAASAGVDNKAVNNAVENAPEVKQADAAVKQAAATLAEALAQAKRVAADPHATQAQVDAAAAKLADARKALADAQANAAKVRAAVRSRVIKGMRSRGNAGIATGANVATTGLMATMIAAIGGAFATRRMRTKHANRD